MSLVFFLFSFMGVSKADSITNMPEYLQSISVQVKTSKNFGSGVVLTRPDSTGTNMVSFIWTAGHLFDLNPSNDIIDIFFYGLINTNSTIIDHAEIIQSIVVDGVSVPAGSNILARVIKLSVESKNDIALLELEKPFFNTHTAVFDLSSNIPRVGDHIYSVSSPFILEQSFSEGVFSFIGRIREGYLYDQTDCVIYPGSSGGGFFLTNGLCVGLASVMRAPNLNMMVPIRRIKKWAKTEHIEWALNPALPIPTEAEIEKIEIKSDL